MGIQALFQAVMDQAPGGPRRLALLGGSFDPPHLGHLHMLRAARTALAPVQLRLLPAACPPHKVGQTRASHADRRRLCELLAAEVGEEVEVDARELERGGVSYTLKTVQEILAEEPTELYFLIGADSLKDLGTWWRIQELMDLVTFVILPRPGVDPAEHWRTLTVQLGAEPVGRLAAQVLDMEPRSESSTAIREAIRTGRPWRHQVPDPVAAYLTQRGLYRD